MGSCDLSIQFESSSSGRSQTISSSPGKQAPPIASQTATPSTAFGFPKATCGDNSTGENDIWYPVFIDGGNLQTIRTQYCADAIATKRKDTGVETVQLASFTSRERVQEFADAVDGDVGQPTYPESVSNTSPQDDSDVEAPNGCDSSYPGICIPAGSADLDCEDIPYRRFTVTGSDPHGFDRDNDGVGCES